MKGTAILYQQDERVIFLEDIEKKQFEEMKKQRDSEHCYCHLENKKIDYGKVSPIIWCDDEIDWEYGY